MHRNPILDENYYKEVLNAKMSIGDYVDTKNTAKDYQQEQNHTTGAPVIKRHDRVAVGALLIEVYRSATAYPGHVPLHINIIKFVSDSCWAQ